MRNRFAATFLRQFSLIYEDFPHSGFVNEYRERNFIVGSEVNVLRGGGSEKAVAVEVDDKCRLVVRYSDGRQEALSSGEVSVRPAGDAI